MKIEAGGIRIEIVEPEDDHIVLHKRGTQVLVRCDCNVATGCPQGKIGSQERCRIWIERDHVSEAGVAKTKRENRFSR